MPFPAPEEKLAEEEERIGRKLPAELRERIADDNGGDIEVLGDFASDEDPADNVWHLVGVADVWEKKGRPRPVDGIHKVTEEHREYLDLPDGAWVVGHDGDGNVLLLMPDDSYKVFWHDMDEGEELDDATVNWRL